MHGAGCIADRVLFWAWPGEAYGLPNISSLVYVALSLAYLPLPPGINYYPIWAPFMPQTAGKVPCPIVNLSGLCLFPKGI